ADIVDDLHPLTFLHLVDHELAVDTVREHVISERGAGRAWRIADLYREIIQEVGVPEAAEVLEDRLFRCLVERYPGALHRAAWFELDVIQIRARLDQRLVALLFPAGR